MRALRTMIVAGAITSACGGSDDSALRGSGIPGCGAASPCMTASDSGTSGGQPGGGSGTAGSLSSGGAGFGGTGGAGLATGGTGGTGGFVRYDDAGTADASPIDGGVGAGGTIGSPDGAAGFSSTGGSPGADCPATAPMTGDFCLSLSFQCDYGSTRCSCLLLLMLPVWYCE